MKRLKVRTSYVSKKVWFKVNSRGLKSKYFDDINKISDVFTEKELRDSNIDIIFRSVIMGQIDANKLADEVYNER